MMGKLAFTNRLSRYRIAWLMLSVILLSREAIAEEEHPKHAKASAQSLEQIGQLLDADLTNARRLQSDKELRDWLLNMVAYHGFTHAEVHRATGLTHKEIDQAIARFGIVARSKPKRTATDPLVLLPYPGGRHPRIGFLDGAIDPQRETKASVFTPWDETSYVVLDVPEAIWSDLGLTYLAHRHIPTIWDQRNINLQRLEWHQDPAGSLRCERVLPNGIVFGTKLVPSTDAVRMEMWLTNGTDKTLTDLRVQNCVLLKGAAGFEQTTNDNKVLQGPFAACQNAEGDRWIITAWFPSDRVWANAECPCMHADPKFPDCPPGQTRRLFGWLSFYQGTDINTELLRIERSQLGSHTTKAETSK